MPKPRRTVIGIGIVASVLFMYLAVRSLDFAALRAVWTSARVLPWVPLGILSYVLGHIVRGHRCRLLVRREAHLSLLTASNVVVVGYASNNVFPARLGEFVRAGMLAERTGIPVAQSFTITFIERVFDGLAILFLLVLGTRGQDVPSWMHDLVRLAMLVFGCATIVMLLGAQSPGLIVTGASRIGNRLGVKRHDQLVSLATSITNAGACLGDPRDVLRIILFSVLVWTLEIGLFLAILPSFGLPASPAMAAVAMSVTNLGLLVPSSPGFIGPFHFFCSRAVMAYGASGVTALAYATVVHLAFYLPVTVWGAAAMLWYGVEVGATAAIARDAQSSGKTTTIDGVSVQELALLSKAKVDGSPSTFTRALVEAVVATDGQSVDPKVLNDVATFVHGQLSALQPQLKALFESGMTFFRITTRLRYFRGYCDLPLETRRVWTSQWSEGRYSLLRQLFKPVRATALLAYYDHPQMAALFTKYRHIVPENRLVR